MILLVEYRSFSQAFSLQDTVSLLVSYVNAGCGSNLWIEFLGKEGLFVICIDMRMFQIFEIEELLQGDIP